MRTAPDPGSKLGGILAWLAITLVVGSFLIGAVLEQFSSAKPSPPASASQAPPPGESNPAKPTSPATKDGPEQAPPAFGVTAKATGDEDLPPVKGMGAIIAKMIYASPPADQPAALSQLAMFSQGPTDELRRAMLQGAIGQRQPALASVEALSKRLTAPADRFLRADADLIAQALRENAPPLTDIERTKLVKRHGFYATLLLDGPTTPEAKAILAEGKSITLRMVGLTILLGAIALLGFGLFITAIVLGATGKLRTRFAPPAPGGSVMLESFAVFVISFILYSAVAHALELPSAVKLLGQWLLLLSALWPLARGMRWPQLRQALGWVSDPSPAPAQAGSAGSRPLALLREVALGIAGHLALLPLVGLGLLATAILAAIGKAISPDSGGLKAHPLGDFLLTGSTIEVILLATLATLWAPIVEETLFRGALYRHFRARLPIYLAGPACGFIFAAMHPQGLFGIPVLMVMGTNFCLLREWRGSLIAPMTAHCLNNGTIVAIVLLLGS